MVAALRIDGSGFDPLSLVLERFADNISNPQPLFEAMADSFARSQESNFSTSGAVHGGWAPLSPRYAAWKSARYPGAPILTLTGQLRASMTSRPFGVEVIDSRRMVVGTAIPYAKYHQQGTARMPQRKIINPPTGAELRDYASTMHRFAFEGVI